MFKESCKVYERYTHTPGVLGKQLYYYPQFAGRFVCNPDFHIDRKDFDSILILYTLRGCGTLLYRGSEYALSANRFALLDCRQPQTYFPAKEEWEFYFIHFSGGMSFPLCEHVYTLNGGPVFDGDDRTRGYVERCINSCVVRNSGYEVLMSKLLSDFLHGCIIGIQGRAENEIAAVCDYIAENYASRLTVEVLAAVFGFSRCWFSSRFKKCTGSTVHEYLTCCRLDNAKRLLLENRLSVEEIARETGFCDVGTFIRAFKRKEKQTPARYRKQYFQSDKTK
ncbi:MAG: helix-turn-helix domain-containing protein [Clostridia bacterium]|nr:helix-turn-helix domain-containing protein [Clostridia bacterium]